MSLDSLALDPAPQTPSQRRLHHTVMWQLKDPTQAAEFQRLLLSCRDLVPGILSFQVGIREPGLEANVDVVLSSVFENADALSAYATHPHHVAVAAQLGQWREQRHVLDHWA